MDDPSGLKGVEEHLMKRIRLTNEGYLDPGAVEERYYDTQCEAKAVAQAERLPRYAIWERKNDRWYLAVRSHRY